MNKDPSVIFKIASIYCILDFSVDYDGYAISSKGFLPIYICIYIYIHIYIYIYTHTHTYTHRHTHIFFIFFSIPVYHRILNIVCLVKAMVFQ